MRQLVKIKLLMLFLYIGTTSAYAQQDCKDDINYTISNVTVNGGNVPVISNDNGSVQITIGQPYAGASGSFNQGISERGGFWGFYELEPEGTKAIASEGEYLDRVEVEWVIVDDLSGPVVTGDLTKIFRNGKLLTTVPIAQTAFVDFNVFPGEFYTYGIVTTNSLGDAKPIDVVGFVNPNGRVTGKVETRNGAPVADVKVTLSPNLGRSLDLDGTNDYMYFENQAYDFGDYYTIEGWWRNVGVKEQTIFVAVDSGTTVPMIKVSLDVNGKIHYYHDGNADGTGIELISKNPYNLTAETRDWHHFAAVYDTTNVYLYVDGNRVAEATPTEAIGSVAEIEIGKDGPKQYTGYYSGYIDEFRIWTIGRERADIRKFKDITLTGEDEYLQAYWKFDEQFGTKIFDYAEKAVEDREHGYICDITRSDFISPAQLGAYTDEGGDYLIKGVYYGGGQTFQVTPSKETSIGYSLDFDGTDDFISYQLDRVVYNDKFTLEGWFKSAVGGQDMVIFEATDATTNAVLIQIGLQATGEFYASAGFSGSLNTITTVDTYNDEFWYHYALVHDGTNVTAYIDAVSVGTTTDGAISNVTARTVIGRSDPIEFNTGSSYFNGSLDEIRLWDYARTANQISGTLLQVIEGDEKGIVDPDGTKGITAYWMIGEGRGDIISDATPNGHVGKLLNYQKLALGVGDTLVTNWNGEDIPLDVEFFVHDFDPNGRNVSIDPSNTSVDRVDFTDISQLGMSGFVKYANADCFAEGIEMKINGESILPPVYTDEEGKFTVELEPGLRNVLLSASAEGFIMNPNFIELPQIVRPISGLRFEITTTRNIKGIVGGGECLFATGTADVRVVSIDGCYEKIVPVDAITGVFEATDIPPLKYEVSVVNHNDTGVQSSFDLAGAVTVDVQEESDSISFIYNSNTEIRLSFDDRELNTCNIQLDGNTATMLNQNREYNMKLELFQVYGLDTCILNSGVAFIDDGISDFSPKDTVDIVGGSGIYTFKAGVPNLADPYNKTISVTGRDDNGAEVNGIGSVIVIGFKTLTSTFETTTPELPLFILRDPPGDGSYAFLEQNEEVCNSFSLQKFDASTSTFSENISMGTDIEFGTGLGFVKTTTIDITADLNFEQSSTDGFGSTIEYETCLSSSEIFSTSVNDLLSDGEGDLFVGGAFNVLVGTNRTLKVNPDNCLLELKDAVMILPTSFATTYLYTEQFIRNSVIPGLEDISDSESVQQWQTILNHNETLKNNAQFKENISFSAGIEFQQSITSTESSGQTMSLSQSFVDQIVTETGIATDGMGFTLGTSDVVQNEENLNETSTQSTSKTVGYFLNDDDIGDSFTIDVKTDAQGMPVFDLVAGESMCPWEPGTRNRIAVNITPNSATNLVDVPEDEPGVFNLSLSNTAETAEDQFYEIRVVQESNPNGATIKINGVIVEESLGIFIKASESEEVVITVEKGPDAYIYTDLELELFVPCELERAEGLGIDIVDLIANDVGRAEFFSRQKISVEFVKTCQDLTIFSPGDDWLINNTDNNQIGITVSDIDLGQAEFDQFKFQYRKNIEGEPFVNGATIVRADITGNSHSFTWDVTAVDDALYELRIVSECNSGFLPGTSSLTNGLIDRVAPTVLGTPTPIDAILNLDDEITITFEENLKCDALISLGIPVSLTQGSMNNVDLASTETSLSIAKDVTCIDNQLIIVPDVQNKFINGQVLRVDLLGLEDLFGNVQTNQITWEFNIDRDPLEWLGGDIQLIADEGTSASATRQVKNNGAFAVNVNLSGALDVQTLEETLLPSWITASPLSFTLQSGGSQEITFTTSNQLSGAQFSDVVTAATSFGAPELNFDLRVLCPEPDWTVDPAAFENSMTITAELVVEGNVSEDEYDLIVAFVDGEIRGVARPEYVAELTRYELFMTVYSNNTSGENITFSVWDASQCKLFDQTVESYTFAANAVLGVPTTPVTITSTNNLSRSFDLSQGWTWVSFNLDLSNADINATLASLTPTQGDLIKSQTQFAQYTDALGWVGTLNTMNTTSMYQVNLSNQNQLEYAGIAVDIETTFININQGWNWISYLPQNGMDVNTALATLSPFTGDLIKNQTDFAQYVENVGWIGSLEFLRPNDGYLINLSNAGTLEYPIVNTNGRLNMETPNIPEAYNPHAELFENTMTITAVLEGNLNLDEGSDAVLVYQGDELRGFGYVKHIEALDQDIFFITTYANQASVEGLSFKLLQQSNDEVYDLKEQIAFAANTTLGTPQEPLVLNLVNTITAIDGELMSFGFGRSYPNPFSDVITIEYQLDKAEQVELMIYDIMGRVVAKLNTEAAMIGDNQVQWDRSSISGSKVRQGIYVLRLVSGSREEAIRLIVKD